ncbi:DUF4365 domain-containing protein [Streptomyces coeruleorubidus]|uniref:DUF4365 domain-containing protein n=1 Tax=Streptomyces coeruleorubidus TaxID=116188 RepID=UPI00379737B8
MPQRPKQHQIASQAVAAVRKIWADVGAGVDEISEDYGEDLLVQPSINGRVDKARLWIQVKGTAADLRLDGDSPFVPGVVEVNRNLALRWLGSADLVIVVRWSVRHHTGWYATPKSTIKEEDLWNLEDDSPVEKVKLRFRKENQFNEQAAEALAWAARVDRVAAEYERWRATAAKSDPPGHIAWTMLIDLLVSIGLISRESDGREGLSLSTTLKDFILEYFWETDLDFEGSTEKAAKWISNSLGDIVKAFIQRKLPCGVDFPDHLFNEAISVVQIIHCIATIDMK